MSANVCFITAIYGNYEATCKQYACQTIPTDFICFTDNPRIRSNGWILDTTPYHYTHKSPIDDSSYVNSMSNNKHTFNIAKYYKQAFQNIPRLKQYDVVVWLDGTVEITNPRTSEWLLLNTPNSKIIAWEHEQLRNGLQDEVKASDFYRYTSKFWNNQAQPFQNIFHQYSVYVADGYTDVFWKTLSKPIKGIWVTCFVAFSNKDPVVTHFLNSWYAQTLAFTTQDQIGFPFVCQKLNIIPRTLPDNEIHGEKPHEQTDFYKRHIHGI